MCNRDIEHIAHVFFDCDFAMRCWDKVGLTYDMSTVKEVTEWLLNKISDAPVAEVIMVCIVL